MDQPKLKGFKDPAWDQVIFSSLGEELCLAFECDQPNCRSSEVRAWLEPFGIEYQEGNLILEERRNSMRARCSGCANNAQVGNVRDHEGKVIPK